MKDDDLKPFVTRRLTQNDIAAQFFALKEQYPSLTKLQYSRLVGVAPKTLNTYLNNYKRK